MDIPRIAAIALPENRRKLSALKLIENAGYKPLGRQPSIEELANYLQNKPELVEAWLTWSSDKRVSSGWYFTRDGKAYTVGFHPNGDCFEFSEPAKACAEFILRELASIAG